MGWSSSAVETIKMGITSAVFAVLFAVIVPMAFTAEKWYMEAENRKSQTGHMKTMADSWMMEQKGSVAGNDIVEFILKNDSRYDYYVIVGDATYPITVKKAESLFSEGKDVCIWSEDYLMEHVFLNHTIYDSYRVVSVRANDETIAYKFYREEP